MKNFAEIIEAAKKVKNMKAAVAAAQDEEALEAVEHARSEGIVEGILVGDKEKIEQILTNKKINPANFKIINEPDEDKAVIKAIELIKSKKANFIVKGKVKTNRLMKHIINKDYGILTGHTLSHIFFSTPQKINNFILVSDGGMLIKPTLHEKESVIKNALIAAKTLKLKPVKIALLSGPLALDEKNTAAFEAGLLAASFREKYYSDKLKFEINGPVDFDAAMSGKVASNIFIVPDIESGNIASKAIMYLSKADCGLLVLGAKAPIVVTSRADTAKTKLNSIALASLASKVKIRFN